MSASNAWPSTPYETRPDETWGQSSNILLGTTFPESPIRAATSASAVAPLKLASLHDHIGAEARERKQVVLFAIVVPVVAASGLGDSLLQSVKSTIIVLAGADVLKCYYYYANLASFVRQRGLLFGAKNNYAVPLLTIIAFSLVTSAWAISVRG